MADPKDEPKNDEAKNDPKPRGGLGAPGIEPAPLPGLTLGGQRIQFNRVGQDRVNVMIGANVFQLSRKELATFGDACSRFAK